MRDILGCMMHLDVCCTGWPMSLDVSCMWMHDVFGGVMKMDAGCIWCHDVFGCVMCLDT